LALPWRVADLLVRAGETGRTHGRIALGQALADGEGGLVAIERGGRIALRQQHLADRSMRAGQAVLAVGVGGIGLGQALQHAQREPVFLQPRRQVALLAQHIADGGMPVS
jgi:hypothetical protein